MEIATPRATRRISSINCMRTAALLSVGVSGLGTGFAQTFGFVAVILASVNIFGGFLVTQRMLAMYKKKER